MDAIDKKSNSDREDDRGEVVKLPAGGETGRLFLLVAALGLLRRPRLRIPT